MSGVDESKIPELPGLQTVEEREAALLARYATFSRDSCGRRFEEPIHPYRGPFQRDRDRILHSAAYRRLSGKLQVFTGDMGDYHRTRLTHTQEVASIARTIGRALRLNEDLVEALALFHDIGHPPYGHAGEDALNACLRDEGGFSHNRYALTIAEALEERYPGVPGLNLTWEVLESQGGRADKQHARPILEAQVVDFADSATYDAHDTDDAVKLGLVPLEELGKLELIKDCLRAVRRRYSALDAELLRKATVHELIDRQVGDALRYSGEQLMGRGFADARAAQASDFRIGASPEMQPRKQELESYLHQQVYRHPRLVTVRQEAQERLQALFQTLLAEPAGLPQRFRLRADQVGLARAVGDYLAGMTDRFCDRQYARIVRGDS